MRGDSSMYTLRQWSAIYKYHAYMLPKCHHLYNNMMHMKHTIHVALLVQIAHVRRLAQMIGYFE